MSPFYRRGVLSPPAVPVRVDGPTPVSGLRDARERFRAALGGISVELAALPWRWPADREPRPSKLLLRLQERANEAHARSASAKREQLGAVENYTVIYRADPGAVFDGSPDPEIARALADHRREVGTEFSRWLFFGEDGDART